jgi:hypothetical protein
MVIERRGDHDLVSPGSSTKPFSPRATVSAEPTNEHANMAEACSLSAGVQ